VEDVDVIQAAILHDTVEDTDTSLEELEAVFGKAVRDIVDEVTDDKDKEKLERKRLQIVHTPHISTKAKLVKMADKLYNLRDLERVLPAGWTGKRKTDYFLWSAKVLLGCRGINDGLEGQLDEILVRNGVPEPASIVLQESETKE
jgi:hypothetical protein